MAWTEITRPQYDRRAYRYASDCSDEEWSLIEPFLVIEPFLIRRKKVGRPRRSDMRHVWNAIQYSAATGCQWAMLPKDCLLYTSPSPRDRG